MKKSKFLKSAIVGGLVVMFAVGGVPKGEAKKKNPTANPPIEHFRGGSLRTKKLQMKSLTAAGVQGPAWGGRVSFTFDDGNVNIYQNGFPIMKKYGLRGTLFPVVGAVQNNESWSVNWNQLTEFQKAGWEIGSHSMTHPDLTKISTSKLKTELSQSKALLNQHGFPAKTFAFPYGESNYKVLDYVTRYYENGRLAWGNNGINIFPYNRYNIVAREVASNTSPEEVKNWIDEAMKNKDWLVLMLHDIVAGEPVDEYEYKAANLEKIAAYTAEKSFPCLTISEAMAYPIGQNLISNPNIESISGNWAVSWTRNNTKKVTTEKTGVARIFQSGRQLKIIGGSGEYSASPNIIVLPDFQKTYIFKMFSQLAMNSGDGVGVYVSEYDTGGQYLGGKWIGGIFESTLDETGFLYKPNSSAVHQIEISVYTEPGVSGKYWGDNFFFGIVN